LISARAVYHVAPETAALRERTLAPLKAGQVLIESLYSAISSGTESMIFRGRMPAAIAQDEVIASLRGGFRYPFTYGYALTGKVIEIGAGVARDWLGRCVLAFHPHQDYAVVPVQDCLVVPSDIAPQAAVFLPNVESALNFIMDGRPVIGEKVMVSGQGVLGLLTTAILSGFPLGRLITADPLADRRARSLALGAMESLEAGDPSAIETLQLRLFRNEVGDGLDLAFELSGNMDALNQTIELTGFAGRIIIGSWYGNDIRPLNLGGHFHRRRIQLISSQVSTISPQLSGRWDKSRRMELVWEWIRRLTPEHLITHVLKPTECQQAFELVSGKSDGVLQAIFEYP